MSKSNRLKITATKKVEGKVHTQSASMVNGRLKSLEKSVDGEVKHHESYGQGDALVEHPMDIAIDQAYDMTTHMPVAGPYVKRVMDEIHFKWMVQEFADLIFKPFFPIPKEKK